MNNGMLIKRVEFDFDIAESKYHKYIFNSISRIVKNDFNRIFSKILAKYEALNDSKNIKINKIEINLNEIYIQEIDNLVNLIEKHIDIEFYKIFIDNTLTDEKRSLDNFLHEYSSTKFIPWWLNSEEKLRHFLKKENILIQDNDRVLNLILNDFIFFEKIYNLLSKSERLFFIKRILGSSYDHYKKIVALKEDIYSVFHKHYSIKKKTNYIIYSSIKDSIKTDKATLFSHIISNEFSSRNIGLDILFKQYDQFTKILNIHSKNFPPEIKKNIHKINSDQKINFVNNQSFSDFSYLKSYFSTLNVDEKAQLFEVVSDNFYSRFENKKLFFKQLFKDKDLFYEFLYSHKNIKSIAFISNISLSDEFKDDANFLLNDLNENYLTIEQNFLELHDTINFTNKSDDFIQLFIRYSYLNSISKNPELKLLKNDFYYDMLNDIAKSGDLNKSNINRSLNNKKILNTDFSNLLFSLSNTYKYSQIPQTTRTTIYYKDMYYYFMKNNKLSFWANRKTISENELLNFIKILVKKSDVNYLKLLFQEDEIINNKLIELIRYDFELFFQIIYIISEGLLDLKSDQYSSIFENPESKVMIIQQILSKRIWNLKSLNYVNKEISKILTSLNLADIKFSGNLKEDLFSENNKKHKEINFYTALVDNSIHDCIIELSSFSQHINFTDSPIYDPIIDKIKTYFIENKKDLLHYLIFFSRNKINKSFLFHLFSLDNILQIFELKFDSNNIKDTFKEIFKVAYAFHKTDTLKFTELLIYLCKIKLFSTNEIIDILSFNQDVSHKDFLKKLNSVFDKEKVSSEYYNILVDNSIHDSIIELSSFRQDINFTDSLTYDPLIDEIKTYFIENKKDLLHYLIFFSRNKINKSFLFHLFSLDNILQIFELKFDSNNIKDTFKEIFKVAYAFHKTGTLKFIGLLIYLYKIKLFSTNEIIDILSFNQDVSHKDYLKKLNNVLEKEKVSSDEFNILSGDFQIDSIKKLISQEANEHKIKQIEKLHANLEKVIEEKHTKTESLKEVNSDSLNISNNNKFSSFDQYSKQINLLNDMIDKIEYVVTEVDEPSIIDSLVSKNFKNKVNIYKDRLNEELIINNFNILTYYIEFGSFPYDSQTFNFKQLKDFFTRTISQNIYLVKKHLFNWSKSSSKLDRFFSIVYINNEDYNVLNRQFENILRIIYPDLSRYLDLFMQTINDIGLLSDESIYYITDINSSGFKNYEYEYKRGTLKRILLSWPKYKFIVKDSPEFLVEAFFSQMININDFLNYDQMISNPTLSDINKKHKFFLKSLIEKINNKIETKKNFTVKKIEIQESIDELQDGIIIYNAGLLLFWPFLNTLFIKLNLLTLKKDGFKDEISKDKAIMATDFIVNGSDSNEKDFIFNKILCGIELDREIDTSVELIDVELEICNSAIKALLSNWKQVKSVQTLRDWYLKREGRLIEKEDSFIIDIENKPPDIFLKSLSWGISMVNYSLMKKKLIVNWKY